MKRQWCTVIAWTKLLSLRQRDLFPLALLQNNSFMPSIVYHGALMHLGCSGSTKQLQLLLAGLRATLAFLSCSPNFLRIMPRPNSLVCTSLYTKVSLTVKSDNSDWLRIRDEYPAYVSCSIHQSLLRRYLSFNAKCFLFTGAPKSRTHYKRSERYTHLVVKTAAR